MSKSIQEDKSNTNAADQFKPEYTEQSYSTIPQQHQIDDIGLIGISGNSTITYHEQEQQDFFEINSHLQDSHPKILHTDDSKLSKFDGARNLNLQHIFQVFDGSLTKSLLCRVLAYAFGAAIIISFISSFMETVPSFRYQPSTCEIPACDNDTDLCPGSIVCEPIPPPVFNVIDAVCIYIFTIEYGVRLFTCWGASSKVAGIVSSSWHGVESDPAPVYPLYEHVIRFVLKFNNIVDLVTILPFWVTFNHHAGSGGRGATFLRVFKLLRMLKIFRRFKQSQDMIHLVGTTLMKSLPALAVLVMFLVLAVIFYGSIIYEIEKGKFMVTSDYPQGAYLRIPINGYGMEVSPFVSIPTSIYWVVTTSSTVGYGDLVPTTWIGRAVACCVMLTGLIVLALPITVVGSNFTDNYTKTLDAKWDAVAAVLDVKGLSESNMLQLFDRLDIDDDKLVSRAELAIGFREMGLKDADTFIDLVWDELDEDASGFVTPAEFITLCKKLQCVHHGGKFDYSKFECQKSQKSSPPRSPKGVAESFSAAPPSPTFNSHVASLSDAELLDVVMRLQGELNSVVSVLQARVRAAS